MFTSTNRIVLVCLLSCLTWLVRAQQNPPQLGRNSIQEVVSAMTLDEKVSLLVGGMNVPGMPMPGGNSAPTDAQKRVLGAECLTPTLLTAI